MMVVVAYDVNTETPQGRKRLRMVAKTCMQYGQRVQNSVFECLVSPSDYILLKTQLQSIINEEKDGLRFYNLGKKYESKIEQMGTIRHVPTDSPMII
ncbi:CRISPR-associated endonuclease Cas2 [Bifidobacterium callitrichos]|nr:CRISPR-associated endonuclease Cas2 [Bifidobacterium callitrichos]